MTKQINTKFSIGDTVSWSETYTSIAKGNRFEGYSVTEGIGIVTGIVIHITDKGQLTRYEIQTETGSRYGQILEECISHYRPCGAV